jgi:hypothetical protein
MTLLAQRRLGNNGSGTRSKSQPKSRARWCRASSIARRKIAARSLSAQLPPGLDALRLYVLMVALTQFHLSNGYTLSTIFGSDLYDAQWRCPRHRRTRHAGAISAAIKAHRLVRRR